MRFVLIAVMTMMLTPAWAQSTTPPEASSLLRDGDKLFAERKYEEARLKYEAAAKAAESAGESEPQTEATAQVARMYALAQNFEKGREWLAMAGELANPERKLGWSRYLGVRGRYEWQDEKDNAKATKTFIEMYDYCMENELFSRALDAAHMVGITGDEKRKEEWALKAIQAAEKSNDTGWLAVLWNNLGWMYDERANGKKGDEQKADLEKALDALVKARKFHHMGGDAHRMLVADFGVAHAYRRVGNLTEARTLLTEAFEKAKARHAEDPKDKDRNEWLGWGHKYLGDLLVDEGKPDEALEHYRRSKPFLVEAGIENWWPEGLKEIEDKIKRLEKQESQPAGKE
jgi:tetratricopeptide (TPR) repeat protein